MTEPASSTSASAAAPSRSSPRRTLHEILSSAATSSSWSSRIWQENDLDGCDRDALHILGYDGAGALVATARLLQDDSPIQVGRIVVRRDRRGQGVGSALLAYIESLLGPCAAVMSAQAYLEDWYTRRGWQREGDVYDEVGIPHVRLVRTGPPRDEP